MTADDTVTRAAEALGRRFTLIQPDALTIAQALADAGLLRSEAHDREVAARALREFAGRQDSWCEAGRAEQLITRRAMRDALNDHADRIKAGGHDGE